MSDRPSSPISEPKTKAVGDAPLSSAHPESHPPLPDLDIEQELARGEMLGRYVVVGVLGRGGMGVVYKAFDSQLNRTLAIKLLHRHLATGEESAHAPSRMFREAQAMARLNHPNVVAVHDVGTFDGRVFLAMEFIDGGTLKGWMTTVSSWRARLAALISAGRGLAAAHAKGLVHRDFKPDNVLVSHEGRIFVTDFGLARAADDLDSSGRPSPGPLSRSERALTTSSHGSLSSSLTSPLTNTGSILGTVGYLAPEQAFREPIDQATDQFSYGVTLYDALYGTKPFPGNSLHEYIDALERPPLPPPIDSEVPSWVHRVIRRAINRNPEERFPSMQALIDALQADPAIAVRKHAVMGGAALGVVVMLATSALALSHRSRECAVPSGELAGIWDPATKEQISRAFEREDPTHAKETTARVTSVLDDHASKLVAMKSASCEATRARHVQPENEYRLRADCLERRENELRALTATLRDADKDVIEKAVSAAYGLTNVSVCADVPMLKASSGLPDDKAARALVLDARARLAHSSSLQLVGKLKEAAAEASVALDLGRRANHSSTVAEALHKLGGLKVEQNEHAAAEPLLVESVWTASRAGADALVVQSASMTAFVVGAKLGKQGEARIWLGLAESALARVGGSDALQLEFDEHKAWLLAEEDGRPEEALRVQQRVVDAYERMYGVHARTLRALYNLGDSLTSIADHPKACLAYAQARDMALQIGGPSYSWAGYALAGVGDCKVAMGDFKAGDAALERAIAIALEGDDGYSAAEALEVVLRSALMQGDTERAINKSDQALKIMKTLDGTASLIPLINVPLAEVLLGSNRDDEALALCEAALAEEDKQGQLDATKILRSDALRCMGDALIHMGRAREAVAMFERSLTITRRTYPGDIARARFGFSRAVLRAYGDRTRARAIAEQAYSEFKEAPFLKHEADEVQRFLRTLE